MTTRNFSLFGWTVLLIAGCAVPPVDRSASEKIGAELKQAAEVRMPAESKQGVLQALLPAIAVELPKIEAADTGPRFDLSVSNAPAPQVLASIVAGTRFSMIVHPDIKAPISLNLKDVTIADVLGSVREIYGFEYKMEGTRIFVQPPTLQTRMFKVDYLTLLRRGSSDIRVSGNSITGTGTGQQGQQQQQQQTGAGATGAQQPGVFGAQLDLNQVTQQGPQTTQMATTSSNDFWSELRATLAALMGCTVKTTSVREETTCGEGRRLVISPQSGTVLVRAMPDELKSVAEYLKASQNSLDKQVLIEAKLLEVTLKDGYETGVNWSKFFGADGGRGGFGMQTPGTTLGTTQSGLPLVGGAPPVGPATPLTTGNIYTTPQSPLGLATGVGQVLATSALATGSVFGVAFQGANFAMLLSFLETQGTVHTLSSPRIATVNNQKAVLKVGSDGLFITRISGSTTTSTTNTGVVSNVNQIPNFEVQSFFSGIALDVTPHIGENGSIVLHVRPTVSSVTQVTQTVSLGNQGTFAIPLVNNSVSETDSVIRAQDGQIVAIGGLMRQSTRDNRDKVPGLGDAELIGGLFRNTVKSSEKRELVILLKPTIVQSDEVWAKNILGAGERVRGLERPDPPAPQ